MLDRVHSGFIVFNLSALKHYFIPTWQPIH